MKFLKEKQSDKMQQTKRAVFSWLPAKPTKVFDTYWKFAAERQSIFFKKVNKHPLPWTKDPILEKYKFTNAYRASDRISQYLIKEVIYKGNRSPHVWFQVLLVLSHQLGYLWHDFSNFHQQQQGLS